MTSQKRYRWICPVCKNGKLATSRPRKNATVRYCLSCSEKDGVLIERTCPTLDKVRHAKQERSKKKLTKQKEKEIQARTFDGVNVDKEVKLQCKILCRAHVWPSWMKNGVRVNIHKSKYRKRARGLSYHSHITLTLGDDVSAHTLKELIFHELTHCACNVGEGHGDAFRSRLVEGARCLWGIVVESGPSQVYDLDREIEDRLKELSDG